MDLVKIEWLDSRGATAGWKFVDDLDEGACKMHSVGWIVKDDWEHVVLAPHMSTDEEQASGVMYIPRSAITHIYALSVTAVSPATSKIRSVSGD